MNNQLLLLINSWAGKNAFLDAIMIFCAQYLIFIVVLVAFACAGYLAYRREWRPAIYFLSTLILSFIILQLVALLKFDHRPFMDHHLTLLIQHASGSSFPSDHTTASTAVALGVLFFMPFKKTGWLLLLAACIIGFSRIFVGVHYPADIISGLLTGLVGGSIVGLVKLKIEPKKQTMTFPER